MLGRHTETLTILVVCSLLTFFAVTVKAAYLCPKTLVTFDTLEECQNFCPGVDCIPSGTYMCSADADGDGRTELYQCQQVYQCPLGDYPCDENNQCSVQGDCKEQQEISKCVIEVSPAMGNSYSIESSPGSCTTVEEDCSVCVDSNCKLSVSGDGCSGDTIFNSHAVYQSVYICGLTDQTYDDLSSCQSACIQTATCTSSWQCPIPGGSDCEDVSVSENYEDETPDLSYYQNDGEVDPDTGQCLGQIYFFNGRPMLCRHAGLQTGFHNCCDADDEVVQELGNQLSLLGGTLAVISKLKDAIGLAYKAIELYTKAASQAAALGATLDEYFLGNAALYLKTPNVVYNSVLEAVKAGGGAADGAVNSIVNGLGLSPTSVVTQIALHFAMDFAMKILFGGCSEDDVITAAYNELGLCHFIGVKCVKKLPIVGCVQHASVYCCFNSKLARIIQEQGRPQLKTINGWGTTDEPNCRGLTPQELEMLDFSKINLYEWQKDITTQAQEVIQENLQQNFNQFVENLK